MIDTLGIQLFSLPVMLDQSFDQVCPMLSAMGYQEVEMYGPYAFSHATAISQWEAVVPMLGFSGSGFFGLSAKDFKKHLEAHDLKATSAHTDLYTLQSGMKDLAEAASVLGWQYVVLPAIPDELRKDLDDYKRMADLFMTIGREAKKYGLRFAYHNHGYGLQELDGMVPLQILLENTDPDLVFFEMDIFWTVAGGLDPVDLLESYPDRYHLLHIKDMKEIVRFSGDGSSASQWFELFPFMTSAGEGVLDIKGILQKAKGLGIQRFFVEQDMVQDPELSLKKSADYLRQ